MAAVNIDTFHHHFCDMFMNHVTNKYHSSSQLDGYRKAIIGCTCAICAKIWFMMEADANIKHGGKPIHLLWTLCFLKVYGSEFVTCSLVKTSRPTLEKWVWIMIESIHLLHGML
jgi:hypothetical protein